MNQHSYQWTVVGAGPAGIAAVGKLLDSDVSPKAILWIDPFFKVGDLGQFWSNVSSNTKVGLFNEFLNSVHSFAYSTVESQYVLSTLPSEDTCTLSCMVEPLRWISNQLMKKVTAVQTIIESISLNNRLWSLQSNAQSFQSQNVILATGAVPSNLNYPGVEVIPFEMAIDQEKLQQWVNAEHTVAVFGSSHSALTIVRHLVELGAKKIINFYRSPCRYAVPMNGWTLFDNTGLKGETALWAREHIDGVLPANLERYNTAGSNITHYLPQCDRVVYAVGFERRKDIVIGDYEDIAHNPYVGIIGPGLFGFGIGYPELKTDPLGNVELQVGLWKFMTYLNRVLPVWFKYST